MEVTYPNGELGGSYIRVPWPSWDHWDFVRSSLFSSSPQSVFAALDRIRAWRGRGRVPVAIEVTAAILEIQQQDPFFSEGQTTEAFYSDEMLSMLYSMAIMRLVNGFVEKVHGFDNHVQKHSSIKDKQSISRLADALGVPRVLVDIRHESSHRDLPSLPLLRLAIKRAIEWLKSNYWEPQKRAIPDVRKEVKCRLRQLVYHIKNRHGEKSNSSQGKGRRIKQHGPFSVCSKLSSQITGKLLSSKSDGTQKHISRILKGITHLYSECPTEIASSLLEFYMSLTPNLSTNIGSGGIDVSDAKSRESTGAFENDLKTVITKLSRKKPGLLLSLLKEVLHIIEAKIAAHSGEGDLCPKSMDSVDILQIEHLSSLVPWLLVVLSDLKYSGLIEVTDSIQSPLVGINIIPKVSLGGLLRRCLLLSASGYKHLSDSALFLLEMTCNKPLSEKLRRLPIFSLTDRHSATECCNTEWECDSLCEEQAIKKAEIEFDTLRSRLKGKSARIMATKDGSKNSKKLWTLAKTWNPCPIGMLPCSFSSSAYFPALDKSTDSYGKREETKADSGKPDGSLSRKREITQLPALVENPSAQKRQKEMASEDVADDYDDYFPKSPMKGMLLIDGVWRRVEAEELQFIGANIRIITN